jgi:hypothetical protein
MQLAWGVIMLRAFLPALSVVVLAAGASAQTIEIKTNQSSASAMSAEQIRVNVNVNVFVRSLGEDGDQALKAQEMGRKVIYEVAGHECAVLRETLAADCRLDSVNVNIQRQNQFGNQPRAEGFNVNGNIGFRIAPK